MASVLLEIMEAVEATTFSHRTTFLYKKIRHTNRKHHDLDIGNDRDLHGKQFKSKQFNFAARM